MNKPNQTVAILGASDNPSRYAHKAQIALVRHGYDPIPVNPRYSSIAGRSCLNSLNQCTTSIDTVTLYLRPELQADLLAEIIQRKPGRVIFNPGSECEASEAQLRAAGIHVQHACTLVLLETGQF